MMKIILGSKSAGRQMVLKRAGIAFTVMVADIDEKAIRSDDYEELPMLLARAKAAALLPRISEPVLLITSDQVIVFKDELREKPENEAEARRYLENSAGAPLYTNTAVVVTNTATGKQLEGLDVAIAYFKPLPTSVIDQLIASGKVYNWAGGVAVEDPLFEPYVLRLEGEIDSITGLPLTVTKQLLEAAEA